MSLVLPTAFEEINLDISAQVEKFNKELADALAPIIERFQIFLRGVEGKNFGYEGNRLIAFQIQKTLESLGVALECQKENCGLPAKLRCRKPGRSVSGVFQFDHPINGKHTSHGGSSKLPVMNIIPFETYKNKTDILP